MAAPGGRGEVRVRLTFDYPPPALPQSRHLWFMLDTDLCRAVTDVSAIIQERFFYSRRGALSLYLDGCLLPPGESVRLIRDNDAISVKWEETCPHNSPRQTWKKRQRSEDESNDSRDLKKMRGVHREAPEKTKKRGEVTSEELLVSEWPKKKDEGVRTPEKEISERPKKKKKVTPEDEVVSNCPKKDDLMTPDEEVVSKWSKKKEGMMTPDEEEVSRRPKNKEGLVTTEEVRKHPKKKKKNERQTPEWELSEQPRKKNSLTPEEVVSKQLKEKVRVPQQAAEESIKQDISKKIGAMKPQYQEEPYSTVQKKDPPPGSTTTTIRKETSSSSSSSSDQEDSGRSRKAEPGPPQKPQQRDGSSSPNSLIIKKFGLAESPPVYNGRIVRGGALHRPPLKTAGCVVGRGRGMDNFPWRGRGFRGQGEARIQNHFFYNDSPETIKQQQLNEDVNNVSVLIQNPPEVQKKDYNALPLLAAPPQPGKIIAFKLLELTENYTPEVSDYKEGRVLSYDVMSQQLEVEILSQQKKKEPGKFDLVYEGEDGMDVVEYAVPQEYKISQVWSSLIEPRLVTEHGPEQHVAPGP